MNYTIEFMKLPCSWYSDRLRAGLMRGQSSSPGRVKNFLSSKSSRRALGFTQLPIQWVPGALSQWVKRPRRETDHSPPVSAEVKKMWIYIHSLTRLHSVVLNSLSTATTLPLPYHVLTVKSFSCAGKLSLPVNIGIVLWGWLSFGTVTMDAWWRAA
jgi:hypothetical protein